MLVRLNLLLLAGLFGVGCASDPDPARELVPLPIESVDIAITAAPDEPQRPSYQPFGKRDPFERDGFGSAPVARFDTLRLRLEGVVWDREQARAMIRDGDVRHIVHEGAVLTQDGAWAVVRACPSCSWPAVAGGHTPRHRGVSFDPR